jgi:hypothetical protein
MRDGVASCSAPAVRARPFARLWRVWIVRSGASGTFGSIACRLRRAVRARTPTSRNVHQATLMYELNMREEIVNVRYMGNDVQQAIDVYTRQFGFEPRTNALPAR